MGFVKGAWKVLVAIKDGLVLLAMLLFFGIILAALSSRPNPAAVTEGALLVKLDGVIVEEPENIDPLATLLGGQAPLKQFRERDVIRAMYIPILETVDPKTLGKDAKTLLQEYLQGKKIALPQYNVVATHGAAHNQEFEIECLVPKLDIQVFGTGGSRRAGEQAAAKLALESVLAAFVKTPAAAKKAAAAPAAVDPLQWWGALTQQFTELASQAVKDKAVDAGKNLGANLAGALVKQGMASADSVLKGAAARVPGAAAKRKR